MADGLPIPAALQSVLASDAWFASCDAPLREALVARAQLWRLAHAERLFARGADADGLCCVTAGGLRIGALQVDGSESLLAYVEPYQWFGEISMIDGAPRTHDAVADGDTTVLVVPRKALHDWLREHPVYWRDLARLACAKLRTSFEVLEDIAHLPLEARLAKRLWLLAHGWGARGEARRVIRLPQEQLALMLGVSRQSANKALRGLEAQGLVVLRYGEIELLDLAALPKIAALPRNPE